MIASVEEGLGLPSPTELAEEKETEEMSRLAEGRFLLLHVSKGFPLTSPGFP